MGTIWGEIYSEQIKAFRSHCSLAKAVCQKSRLLIYSWHSANRAGAKENPFCSLHVGYNFNMCVPGRMRLVRKFQPPCCPNVGLRCGLAGKVSTGVRSSCKGEALQATALWTSLPRYLPFYHYKSIFELTEAF